jgi:hypothetical protein
MMVLMALLFPGSTIESPNTTSAVTVFFPVFFPTLFFFVDPPELALAPAPAADSRP